MTATVSPEEIRAQLAQIVHEVCNVPTEDVHPDSSFLDDLDADSLAMNEIIYETEERFGVSIPDSEVKHLRTVAEAIEFIREAMA